MDEEQQDWFPKVRDGLGRKKLRELGARSSRISDGRRLQITLTHSAATLGPGGCVLGSRERRESGAE
jgi:hypothetical protein